jgi:hypothetical protein
MTTSTRPASGAMVLAEMIEFGGFDKGTQRYIRRSLDVGLHRRDPVKRWSRDPAEAAAICDQEDVYRGLDHIRAFVAGDCGLTAEESLLAPLITITGFDLCQDRLPSFASYRFLYERLIGASVRPWLTAAFCAAAALPQVHPDRRRTLLSSITEATVVAPGWSNREPIFYPEWVEKVDVTFAD